jgi:hypothetical protein
MRREQFRIAARLAASRKKANDRSQICTPVEVRIEQRHGEVCRPDDNEFTCGPDRQPPDRPSGP